MKKFITMLALLALAACDTPVKIEYRYKNVLIKTPTNLLQDCDLAPPPDIVQFLKADDDKREEMWSKAYKQATQFIIDCNVRMRNARKWGEDQEKIYKTD